MSLADVSNPQASAECTAPQKGSESANISENIHRVDRLIIDDCLERVTNYNIWTACLCLYVAIFLAMSHRVILEVPVRAYTRPSSYMQFYFEEGPMDHYVPPRKINQLVSNTTRVKFFWFASLLCCSMTLVLGYTMKRRLRLYKKGAQMIFPRILTRPEQMRHLRTMRWRILETAGLMPLLFLCSLFLFLTGVSEYLYTLNPFGGYAVIIFIGLAMAGSLWLTVGLAHQISFVHALDFSFPGDPAFPCDDPQLRREAMALYSNLETEMSKQLSHSEGEDVVEQVRHVMSQLLLRDVNNLKPENKDVWRELWRLTLKGRAAITVLLIQALEREVSRRALKKEAVIWNPWMDEALTCIDAMLASAPEAYALSLEAISGGKLLVSLLAQSDIVAGQVLACLASRKSSLTGHDLPSITNAQALRNLIAGAKQLAFTGRVDPLALRQLIIAISEHVQDDVRRAQDEEFTGMLSQFNVR